jgi:hypothetical protein
VPFCLKLGLRINGLRNVKNAPLAQKEYFGGFCMKNWKKLIIMAILLIFGIVGVFIACDDGKNDPVLCKCDIKEHLEAGQSCDCGGEDCNCSEAPKVQPDTTKPLSFGTVENPCSVTVKSGEKFTDTEWDTLVGKVIVAIIRGYNKDMSYLDNGSPGFGNASNKGIFAGLFADDNIYGSISIVLSNSAIYNCEVKSNDYNTMYLKINALDAIDLEPAVKVMDVRSGSYPN